jgi:hypothetical protein
LSHRAQHLICSLQGFNTVILPYVWFYDDLGAIVADM